jgi:hypothetical protein
MKDTIIVSRHPAAIEFIRRERPDLADVPVVAHPLADCARPRTSRCSKRAKPRPRHGTWRLNDACADRAEGLTF